MQQSMCAEDQRGMCAEDQRGMHEVMCKEVDCGKKIGPSENETFKALTERPATLTKKVMFLRAKDGCKVLSYRVVVMLIKAYEETLPKLAL